MCTLKLRNLAHGQLKSRFLAEIKENGQYQGFRQNHMKRPLDGKSIPANKFVTCPTLDMQNMRLSAYCIFLAISRNLLWASNSKATSFVYVLGDLSTECGSVKITSD